MTPFPDCNKLLSKSIAKFYSLISCSCLPNPTASNPTGKKQVRRTAAESFAVGADGRMVINETDSEPDEAAGSDKEEAEAENYYLESQKSQDGFTRGQGNKIKFNKRRRGGMDVDEEMMDVDQEKPKTGGKKRKGEKSTVIILGKDYKAKVRYCSFLLGAWVCQYGNCLKWIEFVSHMRRASLIIVPFSS